MGFFGRSDEPQWDESKLRGVEWRDLELLIGDALSSKGYDVEVTQPVKDGGVDVAADRIDVPKSILYRPKIAPRKKRLIIDAKQWNTPVGVNPVKAIAEIAEERGGTGVIASPAGFTASAKEQANKIGVRLYDADRVIELFNSTAVEVPE